MLMQNYEQYDMTIISGKGSYLFDENGKKYLDMFSGIGVNQIGHTHPKWVEAVCNQAKQLEHVSNRVRTVPSQKFAEKIAEISGMHSIYFTNSGAESNEALIKAARKYACDKYGITDGKIATLNNGFHGKTITTLAATGIDEYHRYFYPFTDGFYHIPNNGSISLQNDTIAVLVEVVQGLGGVNPLQKDFLFSLQKLCNENDILFMIDEVQTGFGRTGKWFGFQQYGLKPDAISFAKGAGSGLPMGGIAVSEKLENIFLPKGTQGTTFGGNPIACAGALAAVEILEKELPFIEEKGERLQMINRKKFGNAHGLGLMVGSVIGENVNEVVQELIKVGVIPLTANGGTLRLLPPLTISNDEIDEYEEKLMSIKI